MRPTHAFIVAATSVMMFVVFRFLLDSEVAGVAMSTTPILLTSWLQTYAPSDEIEPRYAVERREPFSNLQVAALFSSYLVVVWGMALLSLASFNIGVADLITRGFLTGTQDGFVHLQFYYIGLGVLFAWLPLLCAFGAFVGPRSGRASFWPYLAGLSATLVFFVCVRFLLVPGSFQTSMDILQTALTLDIGQVQGGQYIALAALIGVFVLMLVLLAGVPWAAAAIRRRFLARALDRIDA